MRRLRRNGTAGCLLALALSACASEEVAPGPEKLPRAPQLAGGPPSRLDYWSDSLRDYVGPEFRATPEEERFARFGRRLLEYRLREDLLTEHRWALSQQDVDAFSGEPDYDASERFLRSVLGGASTPESEPSDTLEGPR